MKIEAGKYYRSSEDKKVGPMRGHTLGNFIETSGDGRLWSPTGEGLNKAVGEELADALEVNQS